MFVRAELKTAAKSQIKGNIGILFLCNLVYGLIVGIPMGIVFNIYATQYSKYFRAVFVLKDMNATPPNPMLSLLMAAIPILLFSFVISFAMIYLNLIKSIKPQIADIFKGFNVFGKATLLGILMSVFTALWSMLFVIPGIIKAISYSMAPYILAENQTMTAKEALNESKRITKGNKMNLFILGLSFIGWILLGGITLGIAFIYITPYMEATMANAYIKIKEQAPQE